jgi:hypothetical protein
MACREHTLLDQTQNSEADREIGGFTDEEKPRCQRAFAVQEVSPGQGTCANQIHDVGSVSRH